jgi:hypothetical protein
MVTICGRVVLWHALIMYGIAGLGRGTIRHSIVTSDNVTMVCVAV